MARTQQSRKTGINLQDPRPGIETPKVNPQQPVPSGRSRVESLSQALDAFAPAAKATAQMEAEEQQQEGVWQALTKDAGLDTETKDAVASEMPFHKRKAYMQAHYEAQGAEFKFQARKEWEQLDEETKAGLDVDQWLSERMQQEFGGLEQDQEAMQVLTPQLKDTARQLKSEKARFQLDRSQREMGANAVKTLSGSLVGGENEDWDFLRQRFKQTADRLKKAGYDGSMLNEAKYQAVKTYVGETGNFNAIELLKEANQDGSPAMYNIPQWRSKIDALEADAHRAKVQEQEELTAEQIQAKADLRSRASDGDLSTIPEIKEKYQDGLLTDQEAESWIYQAQTSGAANQKELDHWHRLNNNPDVLSELSNKDTKNFMDRADEYQQKMVSEGRWSEDRGLDYLVERSRQANMLPTRIEHTLDRATPTSSEDFKSKFQLYDKLRTESPQLVDNELDGNTVAKFERYRRADQMGLPDEAEVRQSGTSSNQMTKTEFVQEADTGEEVNFDLDQVDEAVSSDEGFGEDIEDIPNGSSLRSKITDKARMIASTEGYGHKAAIKRATELVKNQHLKVGDRYMPKAVWSETVNDPDEIVKTLFPTGRDNSWLPFYGGDQELPEPTKRLLGDLYEDGQEYFVAPTRKTQSTGEIGVYEAGGGTGPVWRGDPIELEDAYFEFRTNIRREEQEQRAMEYRNELVDEMMASEIDHKKYQVPVSEGSTVHTLGLPVGFSYNDLKPEDKKRVDARAKKRFKRKQKEAWRASDLEDRQIFWTPDVETSSYESSERGISWLQ